MTDIDRFLICLPYTLAQECPYPDDWSNPRNFSNDLHDPGGATMCGIIQSEYDRYRQSMGLQLQSVLYISEFEGQTIYRQNYWLPKCPTLMPGLDLSLFDTAVNCGPFAAVKILQAALGVEADGIWGPITQGAVDSIANDRSFLGVFAICRKNYYRSLSNFQYFGNGWISRTNSICSTSVSMAPTSSLMAAAPSDYTIGTDAGIPVAITAARQVVPQMFWGYITYDKVAPLVADIVKAALDAVNAAHEPQVPPSPPTEEQLS